MHPDDFEDLGALGFGFAWAAIVQTLRVIYEHPVARVGAPHPSIATGALCHTTVWTLPSDWMANRAN